MKEMSKDFFQLNNIFYNEYNYEELIKYEDKKHDIVIKMFDEIINCFSILKEIPCAIYLNGSYSRKCITAKSDLDLTFYFRKQDIEKYKTLVYLFRYAISIMFNVNIVHVHSFTKNFTTKYRKENNLIEYDDDLQTKIIWNLTKEE